jgi:hypothetical protein
LFASAFFRATIVTASPFLAVLRYSGKDPMADRIDPAPGAKAAPAEEKRSGAISRREFARRAAFASAVASIAPAAAISAHAATATASSVSPVGQDPPSTPPTAVAPQNSAPNAPKLSAESQSEADARFQAILVLYGSRFSDDQKNDLHRLCAVVQPSLDHIRAYKVENGDGPALYLKPQYEREKKPKTPAVAPAKSAGQSNVPTKSAPAGNGPKKP